MASLQEIRAKYPQYDDMSDEQLATSFHRKFYSDMPFEEFSAKIGYQTAPQVGIGEDMAKSVAMAIPKGVVNLGGFGGSMRELAAAGAGKVAGLVGGNEEATQNFLNNAVRASGIPMFSGPSGAEFQRAAEQVTGDWYEPQTVPGQYADTLTQFGVGSIAGPGSWATKAASAVGGGLASETAGQMTRGSDAEPYARLAGGLIGGAAGHTAANRLTAPKGIPAPSTADIHKAKTAAYSEAKSAGVVFDNADFTPAMSKVIKAVVDEGASPELNPGTFAAMKKIASLTKGNPSLQDLDTARKIAVQATKSGNPSDGYMAARVIEGIDDYIANAGPHNIISGDAARGAAAITNARGLAKKAAKADALDTAEFKAENATGSNYTAAGMETAIKQKYRQIADSKNFKKFYSPEEQEAILTVVRGSKGNNLLRKAGRMAPSGGALSGMFNIGMTATNPWIGVPLMGATAAAKHISSKSTLKNAKLAEALVKGGPGSVPKLKNKSLEQLVRALLTAPASVQVQPREP